MPAQAIPFILGSFFVTVAVIVALLLVFRKRREQAATGETDGHITDIRKGFNGEYEGTPFVARYFPGGKNNPPTFTLTMTCGSDGQFVLSRENRFTRFAKRIGLVREIQTMDGPFDTSFYIDSQTPDFCKQYFQQGPKRQAAAGLFEKGFTRLVKKNGSIQARWSPFKQKKTAITGEFIDQFLPDLHILSRHLPVASPEDMALRKQFRLRLILSYAFLALLEVAALVLFIYGIVAYKPVDKAIFPQGLLYGAVAFVFLLACDFQLLKGFSAAHTHLLIQTVLLLCLAVFGGMGGLIFFNGYLDESFARDHRVPVVRKYYTKNKSNYSYYCRVNSWRVPGKQEKIRLKKGEYDRLQAGRDFLLVSTRQGHFNYEWLEAYTVLYQNSLDQ